MYIFERLEQISASWIMVCYGANVDNYFKKNEFLECDAGKHMTMNRVKKTVSVLLATNQQGFV